MDVSSQAGAIPFSGQARRTANGAAGARIPAAGNTEMVKAKENGRADGPADEREPSAAERAARRYLLAVVMPLWIASGATDYVLHRRAEIERNAGSYEARLHVLGIGLSSLPVLAGLFLEINAGVLLAMAAGYVAHLGMTVWDVAYADERRTIVPLEQHVHGMLEVLPFTALSLAACAHHQQFAALFGRGGAHADFSFRRKRVPLPGRAVTGLAAGFGIFVALPFAEELVRCLRYERAARRSGPGLPAGKGIAPLPVDLPASS